MASIARVTAIGVDSVNGEVVPVPPAGFCNLPNLPFAGPLPKTLTVVQTPTTEEVTITAGGSGGFGGALSTVASKSTTGDLSAEITFKSNTSVNQGLLAVIHTQLQQPQTIDVGIAVSLIGGGMGILFDFVTLSTIGVAFPVSYPFTISTKLDQAAGTATFEFKDGVNPDQSGSANVAAGYDNTEFTFLGSVTTNIAAASVVVHDLNFGSSAFTLANSNGVYCDYENKVFCPADDATVHNSSGSQTVETGFFKLTGSLATLDLIENTVINKTSGIAKAELWFTADFNAPTSEKLTVGFTANNGASQTIYCQLTIDPPMQTVFDLVASANVETGVVMVAGVYKIWIEFNLATGAATYTDTLGNTGALATTGYSANDNFFYKYSARCDTNGDSSVTAGYNSGIKEFSNGLGTGKCALQ